MVTLEDAEIPSLIITPRNNTDQLNQIITDLNRHQSLNTHGRNYLAFPNSSRNIVADPLISKHKNKTVPSVAEERE